MKVWVQNEGGDTLRPVKLRGERGWSRLVQTFWPMPLNFLSGCHTAFLLVARMRNSTTLHHCPPYTMIQPVGLLFSPHLVMYSSWLSWRAPRCGGTGGGVPASVPDCHQPVTQQAMPGSKRCDNLPRVNCSHSWCTVYVYVTVVS